MLLSQSAVKIWNIYFIFIRMSDMGMFFCQSHFFPPCERLSLLVSNNADKYIKLRQLFCSGQFFYSVFSFSFFSFFSFGNFYVRLIKTDNTVRLWQAVEWMNKQKSTSFSTLLPDLSSTSTHCPLFPALAPPLQAHAVQGLFSCPVCVCPHWDGSNGPGQTGRKCFDVPTAPPGDLEAKITEAF